MRHSELGVRGVSGGPPGVVAVLWVCESKWVSVRQGRSEIDMHLNFLTTAFRFLFSLELTTPT